MFEFLFGVAVGVVGVVWFQRKTKQAQEEKLLRDKKKMWLEYIERYCDGGE